MLQKKKKKKKEKKSEGKAKKKVVTVFGDSMTKNLDSREISTSNLFKIRLDPGATIADLLDHVRPSVC